MNRDTSHWSIGEVLMLLQADFPEVTISKIRFLESQGLINPERTPSGYRRFYERDFDRLRWILIQQRDNYLPLKVIRDRLLSGEPLDDPMPEVVDTVNDPDTLADEPSVLVAFLTEPLVDLTDSNPDALRTRDVAALWDELASDVAAALIDQPTPLTHHQHPTTHQQPTAPQPQGSGPQARQETIVVTSTAAMPESLPTAHVRASDVPLGPTDLQEPTVSPPELNADPINHEELATLAGCEVAFLHELERFHLIEGERVGGSVLFDPRSVEIALLAARFAERGLDPRHLRAFRLSVEREAGLIAQVIEPGLHRRDPTARREVFAQLDGLISDAERLHAALLDSVMSEQFPDRLF